MFLAGRTGRWHAVATHFCPSPGRGMAASVAGEEKGFIFQAVHQESHFNAFPASISLLPPPLGSGYLWGGRRDENTEERDNVVSSLWKPSHHGHCRATSSFLSRRAPQGAFRGKAEPLPYGKRQFSSYSLILRMLSR